LSEEETVRLDRPFYDIGQLALWAKEASKVLAKFMPACAQDLAEGLAPMELLRQLTESEVYGPGFLVDLESFRLGLYALAIAISAHTEHELRKMKKGGYVV